MTLHGDDILPSLTDTPASQVFDKKDMATRGIMQPAPIIFNENDASIKAANAVLKF